MNSKPPRILFVEDHQDTLDLFVLALAQENYEIVTATSIESAFAEANAQHLDLMVLDSWVGDGSGVDLCRRIREWDQATPILFCSGVAYEKNKREALNAGAQGYLVKPVSIEDLYVNIRRLILAARKRVSADGGRALKNSGDLALAPS